MHEEAELQKYETACWGLTAKSQKHWSLNPDFLVPAYCFWQYALHPGWLQFVSPHFVLVLYILWGGIHSCQFSAFLGDCWSGLPCPHLGLGCVTKCLKDLTHPPGALSLGPMTAGLGSGWGLSHRGNDKLTSPPQVQLPGFLAPPRSCSLPAQIFHFPYVILISFCCYCISNRFAQYRRVHFFC